MARKAKTVRTFHLLDMATSIQVQNQAVGLLLAACENVLSFNPKMTGAEQLRQAVDACRAAMYPDDGDEP